MPRAAIDIGSNSLLLTVLGDDGALLHDEARVVGLGKGLGDRGLFAPDRMDAAREVLTEYLAIAAGHGVQPWSVRAVATSAARRAMNAETFFARIKKDTGLRVSVISGAEEARLTWLGALRDLELPEGPVLVIDLGGGSTEVVLGQGDEVYLRQSLELGSARLTEEYLGIDGPHAPAGLARMRRHIDEVLGELSFEPQPRTVLGVAGTVTTLAAMTQGLTAYDGEAVHGSQLTRTDLAGWVDALLPATPEQRREIGAIAPGRADFLVAGATVISRILHACRRQHLLVSDRGLRFGLLG